MWKHVTEEVFKMYSSNRSPYVGLCWGSKVSDKRCSAHRLWAQSPASGVEDSLLCAMAASRARSEPRMRTGDHLEEDNAEGNPFWSQRARLEFLRNQDEAEAPENSAEEDLQSISAQSGEILPAIQDDDASEELLEAETLVAGAGPQTANELSATTRGMSTSGEPLAGRTTWPTMSSRWIGGPTEEAQPTSRTMTPTGSRQHVDEGRPTTPTTSSMVEGVSSMASRVLVEQPTTSRTMTSSMVAPGLVRPSTGSTSSRSMAPGMVRSSSGSMSSSRLAPTSRSMTTTRSDAGGGQATAGRMSTEVHEPPRGPPRSWMPGEIHPQGGQAQAPKHVEEPMDLERELEGQLIDELMLQNQSLMDEIKKLKAKAAASASTSSSWPQEWVQVEEEEPLRTPRVEPHGKKRTPGGTVAPPPEDREQLPPIPAWPLDAGEKADGGVQNYEKVGEWMQSLQPRGVHGQPQYVQQVFSFPDVKVPDSAGAEQFWTPAADDGDVGLDGGDHSGELPGEMSLQQLRRIRMLEEELRSVKSFMKSQASGWKQASQYWGQPVQRDGHDGMRPMREVAISIWAGSNTPFATTSHSDGGEPRSLGSW